MDFPITDLIDQDDCFHKLVGWLHHDGLDCPNRKPDDHLRVHRRHRVPILDHRRTACGRVSNAFTDTPLAGTHRTPAEIGLILRGLTPGVPTAHLARELSRDRQHLLELRHLMQDDARWLDRNPLGDDVIEGDEMYQNAREKEIEQSDPDDPPRSWANHRRGHGPFANDRPSVARVVGRDSGEIRWEVVASAGAGEMDEFMDRSCRSGARVKIDEWSGNSRVGGHHDRILVTVDHSGPKGTHAIDADGDGVREVDCNTMEEMWTGLRNFLRPFRGLEQVVPAAVRDDVSVGP